MSEFDPVLADSEIMERVERLIGEAGNDEERLKFARFVYDFQRGEAAEKAVRALLESVALEHVKPLVHEHVLADQALANVDYCSPQWTSVLAARLVELGYAPVDQEADVWRVGWPGGETLRGEELCRTALVAVWLRKMAGLPGG